MTEIGKIKLIKKILKSKLFNSQKIDLIKQILEMD